MSLSRSITKRLVCSGHHGTVFSVIRCWNTKIEEQALLRILLLLLLLLVANVTAAVLALLLEGALLRAIARDTLSMTLLQTREKETGAQQTCCCCSLSCVVREKWEKVHNTGTNLLRRRLRSTNQVCGTLIGRRGPAPECVVCCLAWAGQYNKCPSRPLLLPACTGQFCMIVQKEGKAEGHPQSGSSPSSASVEENVSKVQAKPILNHTHT